MFWNSFFWQLDFDLKHASIQPKCNMNIMSPNYV